MKRLFLIPVLLMALLVGRAQPCCQPAGHTDSVVRVACIGNSITHGYTLKPRDQVSYPARLQVLLGDTYCVKNFGVSGRTMLQRGDHPYMKEQAWRDALDFQPHVAIVKLGTNDSKPENWQYGKDFRRDLQTLIDSLKQLPTRPHIYLCTPIPAFKPTWNISDSVIIRKIIPTIRRVARKNKCTIIDLHTLYAPYGDLMLTDGIHPNVEGAAKIAELVGSALQEQ